MGMVTVMVTIMIIKNYYTVLFDVRIYPGPRL